MPAMIAQEKGADDNSERRKVWQRGGDSGCKRKAVSPSLLRNVATMWRSVQICWRAAGPMGDFFETG